MSRTPCIFFYGAYGAHDVRELLHRENDFGYFSKQHCYNGASCITCNTTKFGSNLCYYRVTEKPTKKRDVPPKDKEEKLVCGRCVDENLPSEPRANKRQRTSST